MREIRPAELSARLAAGEPVVLIDVREPWEHALAALPGSRLIPLGELGSRTAEIVAPPDGLVVTYCHHGMRSLSAAAVLEQAGIGPVVSLAGGIDAWASEVDRAMARY